MEIYVCVCRTAKPDLCNSSPPHPDLGRRQHILEPELLGRFQRSKMLTFTYIMPSIMPALAWKFLLSCRLHPAPLSPKVHAHVASMQLCFAHSCIWLGSLQCFLLFRTSLRQKHRAISCVVTASPKLVISSLQAVWDRLGPVDSWAFCQTAPVPLGVQEAIAQCKVFPSFFMAKLSTWHNLDLHTGYPHNFMARPANKLNSCNS